jgi:putative membrane protein
MAPTATRPSNAASRAPAEKLFGSWNISGVAEFYLPGAAGDLEGLPVAGFIPYCGSPPVPGALHWNFDLLLVSALLLLTAAHTQFARSRGVGKRDLGASCLGWLLLSLVLISPLCNLSVALFSARVTQHMAIALIAAPMIAKGFISTRTSVPWRASNIFAWGTTFAFTAVFWIWHSPAFYDETLRSNVTYWLMHATTGVAALALWIAVFSSSAPVAFLILFVTGVQMSLLGALLTFAAAPLFSVHEFTTAAWGLTWLEDQQLGGLLMWVPAGLLLTAYSVLAFGSALRLESPGSPGREKTA